MLRVVPNFFIKRNIGCYLRPVRLPRVDGQDGESLDGGGGEQEDDDVDETHRSAL